MFKSMSGSIDLPVIIWDYRDNDRSVVACETTEEAQLVGVTSVLNDIIEDGDLGKDQEGGDLHLYNTMKDADEDIGRRFAAATYWRERNWNSTMQTGTVHIPAELVKDIGES